MSTQNIRPKRIEIEPLPPPFHVIINGMAAVGCYAFTFWLGLLVFRDSSIAVWVLWIWIVFFALLGSLATLWLVRWNEQRRIPEWVRREWEDSR